MSEERKVSFGTQRPTPGASDLDQAINFESYEYLEANAPGYLVAIERAVNAGATPLEVQRHISRKVGQERSGMARRCGQAAAYIFDRMQDQKRRGYGTATPNESGDPFEPRLANGARQ